MSATPSPGHIPPRDMRVHSHGQLPPPLPHHCCPSTSSLIKRDLHRLAPSSAVAEPQTLATIAGILSPSISATAAVRVEVRTPSDTLHALSFPLYVPA